MKRSKNYPVIDVQFFLLELQVCFQRCLSARVIEAELEQLQARWQRPALQSLESNTGSQVSILYAEQLTYGFKSIWT